MTITELAKQLKVSKGTIYNRLKAAGIDITSLRDSSGNDLSYTGVQTISAMFDNVSSVEPDDSPDNVQPEQQIATTVDTDLEQIHALQMENAVLRERVAALERECNMLRGSVEDWKEQAKTSTRMLTGYVERPGIFKRILGKFGRNSEVCE